jgi:fumarate reductase subunit D
MTPQNQQQSPIQSVGGGAETVREQDKIMLVLAYLGIFALIPLLTVKDSEYVKWHAKQGLVLGLGGGVALMILAVIVGFIPVLGAIVDCLLWLGFMALNVMGMIKAIKGERWQIPIVSDLASKF